MSESNNDREAAFDLGTGGEVLDFPAYQGAVRDLDFSPDDRQPVSVGEDGRVKGWKVPSGTLQWRVDPLKPH